MVKTLGAHFIIGGDFNMPPSRLKEAPTWLDDIVADMLVPELQVTCTAGKGRVLDFFVVSLCVLPMVIMVEPEPDPSAQWAPPRRALAPVGR